MDDLDALPEIQEGGSNTIALFLGLYLLILAFFILLVSISSLEEVRTQQIMDSLSSTFTTILPPSTELTPFQKDEGEIIAGQAFQEKITGIFATTLQIATVDVVQPGRLMKVSLPVSALFEEDEAEMRKVQIEMLDRIVASISARPSGIRYDLEFVIGSRFVKGTKNLPVGETLEMARAGAFAREMLSRGVPPDSVSVGMRHADPTQIDLWFHTREEDEARLRFDHLLDAVDIIEEEIQDESEDQGTQGVAPSTTPPASLPLPASTEQPTGTPAAPSEDSGSPPTGFVLPVPPGGTPGGEPAVAPTAPTALPPRPSTGQPSGGIPLPVPPQGAIEPSDNRDDPAGQGGGILLPPRPSDG